ncbi:hypothetical protein PR202_ga19208 [Eleusine coracana subsp. coracana]|uniref:Secreted protein n=1 Tax=Eleusine coracana subsp. coracana TaxID=191504 RepID=A0AAV5CV54_ELECO|nr:hypothetical protein PR202_ga19208 [Eleusine coracana subsp. coracana]
MVAAARLVLALATVAPTGALTDDVLVLVVFKMGVSDPLGRLAVWMEDDDPRTGRITLLSLLDSSLSDRLPRALLCLDALASLSLPATTSRAPCSPTSSSCSRACAPSTSPPTASLLLSPTSSSRNAAPLVPSSSTLRLGLGFGTGCVGRWTAGKKRVVEKVRAKRTGHLRDGSSLPNHLLLAIAGCCCCRFSFHFPSLVVW